VGAAMSFPYDIDVDGFERACQRDEDKADALAMKRAATFFVWAECSTCGAAVLDDEDSDAEEILCEACIVEGEGR